MVGWRCMTFPLWLFGVGAMFVLAWFASALGGLLWGLVLFCQGDLSRLSKINVTLKYSTPEPGQ